MIFPLSERMNPEYEKRLEREIDRRLKGLPPLVAPATLVARVLAVIENRMALPWYRQAWPAWPLGLRAVSLLILLGGFGALCFAGWEVSQVPSVLAAGHRIAAWFSGLNTVWNAVNALGGAAMVVAKYLGTGFIVGCLAAVGVGYALCLGLGTFYVRLALARR
jgi:hypothetical protein